MPTPLARSRSATAGALAARLRKGSVLRFSRAGEVSRDHPMQKPVPLLATLIETSSNRGEVVLDSFCGTGSTLVAAVMTGRRAIGIECDEKYVERAIAKVSKAQALMRELGKIA